jgi:hypothetical protein
LARTHLSMQVRDEPPPTPLRGAVRSLLLASRGR